MADPRQLDPISFLESHPYPILRIGPEGEVLFANPASTPILLEWNTEVGRPVPPHVKAAVAEVCGDGIALKQEVVHGQVVLELTFAPSRSGLGVDVFGQDVTLVKRAQNALVEARDEARTAKESLERAELIGRYGSWELDLRDGSQQWSKGLHSVLGFEPGAVPTSLESVFSVLDAKHHEPVRKLISDARDGRLTEFAGEYTLTLRDRSRRWVQNSGRVVHDEQGRPVKLIGAVRDITDVMRAQEEARFYQSSLDRVAIVAITNRAGVITHANDRFCEISGYSRAELIGKTHQIINSGEMEKGYFRDMWKRILAGQTWHGEICNRAKDGTHYWVDTYIVPIVDTEGRPEQFVAIRVDTTARKRAEKALLEAGDSVKRAYRRLADAEKVARFGSFEWALEGGRLDCSAGMLQVMGWPEEEVVTYAKLVASVQSDDRKILEPAMEAAVVTKQPFSCAFRVEAPGGGTRWIRSEGAPQLDSSGRVTKLLGTLQDVTEKIQVEFELTEATAKAEAATRAKAEFLANMSHEIRTPMNGVIGMCNLLMLEVKDPMHLERLQIIQNCGNSLLNIINDTLDFSKMEAGRIELEKEPFNVHNALKEILQLLNPKALEKGIALSYDPGTEMPQWVLGDVTRTRQVLSNLVGNAIKFTETGGVQVSSASKMRPDGHCELQFSVKDSGIGIPESARQKLFTSFSQADLSTTRKYGGTGLGLAICKGLCELMGGRIWFESQANVGTTFSFTMVVAVARPEDVPVKGVAQLEALGGELVAQAHPHQILIAEDNRVNQLVAVGLLQKLGYRPDVAANGLEVLSSLQAKTYDLILMDVHMPEMDGITATRRIREVSPAKRPRIVALTASAMKEDIDRCLEAGMDDFVCKPIVMQDLLRILVPEKAAGSSPAPLVDSARLLKKFEGLEDVLQEAVQSFLKESSLIMDRILQAVAEGNAKDLELHAHTLKGAASNFGPSKVVEKALALEKTGRGSSWESKAQVPEELQARAEELLSELKALQGELTEVAKRAGQDSDKATAA